MLPSVQATDEVVDASDIVLWSLAVIKGSGITALRVAALCPSATDFKQQIVAPSQRELQPAQGTSKGNVNG